jgi:hypothetical protein
MAIRIKRSKGSTLPTNLEEGQLAYSYGLSGLYIGPDSILIGGQKIVSEVSDKLNDKIDKYPNHPNELALFNEDGSVGSIPRDKFISGITVDGDWINPDSDGIVNIVVDSEAIRELQEWSGRVDSNISSISGKLDKYVTSIKIGGTSPKIEDNSFIPAFISGTFDTTEEDNQVAGIFEINAIPTSAISDLLSLESKNIEIPTAKSVVDYVNEKLTSAVIYKGVIDELIVPDNSTQEQINAIVITAIGTEHETGAFYQVRDWQYKGHSGPARAILDEEGNWGIIGDNAREAGNGLALVTGNKLTVSGIDNSLNVSSFGVGVNLKTNGNIEVDDDGLYVSGLVKNITGTGVTRNGDDVEINISTLTPYTGGIGISVDDYEINNEGVLNASIYGNATRVSGAITIPAPSIQYTPVTSGLNPNVVKTAGVGGLIVLEDIDDGTW